MTPLAWLTPRHAMTALVAVCACILIRHDATVAILAIALVAALAAMTVALIGGNAIRDDQRRRIDGLNSECARRNQVIDYLTTELHAERRRGQMRVVPPADNETAGRILDVISSNEAKRSLDNDERIHGWLQQPSQPDGDAS